MGTLLNAIANGNTQRRVSQAQIDQSRITGENTQALTAQQNLANDLTEQDAKDGNIITRAWADTNGDPQAALKNAVSAGVSSKGNQALQRFISDHQTGLLTQEGKSLENHAAANTQAGNAWQALQDAPDEKKPEVWATMVRPTMQRLAPGAQWSTQVPDAQIVAAHLGLNGFTEKLVKQAQDRAATNASDASTQKTKQEMTAAAKAQGIQELQTITDPNTGMPSPEAYAAWRQKHPEIVAPDVPVKGFISSLTRSTIPVKDQPEFDIQTHQAAALQNLTPESVDQQVDAVIPPAGDSVALNTRTKALARHAISMGLPLTAVQAVIKDGSDQLGRTETAMRTAAGTAPTKISINLAEHQNRQGSQDSSVLSDDDFKRAGAEYAITGVMPALGNGSGPVKQRLIHEKMEFARNSGLGPRDMALAGAAFKGDAKSLAAFQTQRDQIASFEQTAQKNLDQFIGLASKIPDTGMPWLNQPLRSLDANVVGSANMAAINAARQVANNEIAKVTSGGGLGGVLSDSARKEVDNFNPQKATLKQTLAVARVLKTDMANRRGSMDNTLESIRGRVGTFGAGGATGGAHTEHWVRDASGKLVKQ